MLQHKRQTLVGLLDVAPLLGKIAITALYRLFTYPFRTVRSPRIYNDVLNAVIRCGLHNITIAQSRYLNSDTTTRYLAYCRKRDIKPQTLELETGDTKVKAHWLGNPDAETVIIYHHGGGYTQPASEGNFLYLERLVKDLNSVPGSRSFAALILAYTLVPEAIYPTQLKEAATLLSHILTKTGRSPANVVLSGDSAGGNLVLSVISHLLHPHPDVPAIRLKQPLGGALLYSPWTAFGTHYNSFGNESLDCMSPLVLRKWSAMFMGKPNSHDPEADPGVVAGDQYTESALNTVSWWTGLRQVVGSVFVAYGSYEVLADPIRDLKKHFTEAWTHDGGEASQISFVEGYQEAHVAPIVDIMTPGMSNTKSETQQAIEEWFKEQFGRINHVKRDGKLDM